MDQVKPVVVGPDNKPVQMASPVKPSPAPVIVAVAGTVVRAPLEVGGGYSIVMKGGEINGHAILGYVQSTSLAAGETCTLTVSSQGNGLSAQVIRVPKEIDGSFSLVLKGGNIIGQIVLQNLPVCPNYKPGQTVFVGVA